MRRELLRGHFKVRGGDEQCLKERWSHLLRKRCLTTKDGQHVSRFFIGTSKSLAGRVPVSLDEKPRAFPAVFQNRCLSI